MLNRPYTTAISKVVMLAGALLAAVVVFYLSYNLVFAQDAGVIMYTEDGDVPVRTFTSTDPEGDGILWDVTGIDADDFEISSRGVLTFMNPPNFEDPTDRGFDADGDGDFTDAGDFAPVDNMYQITVRASEMRSGTSGLALSTETHVTVQVTDRNEPGSASLNRRQPEVGTSITASLDDPDGERGADNNTGDVVWNWFVSTVTSPVIDAENHWAPATGTVTTGSGAESLSSRYIPRGDCVDGTRGSPNDEGCPATGDPNAPVDETKMLRAVATYDDRLGTGRKARVVSEFPVRAEVSSDLDGLENPANGSPGFDPNLDYTRTVLESLGRGMNVGAPVVANDPNNDTLTYELMALDDDDDPTNVNGHADAADAGYFSIDMKTGQVKVKSTLDWDMNGNPPDGQYKFRVVAIDPSGETAEKEVTVVAQDDNDAPVIMGSRRDSLDLDAPTPNPPSEIRVMEQDSDDRDGNGSPEATYYGTSDGVVSPVDGTGMGLPVALVLGNQNVFTVSDEDERGQQHLGLCGEMMPMRLVLSPRAALRAPAAPRAALTGPDEPIALVFTNPPDFEMPTDANGDSVYKVILVATGQLQAPRTPGPLPSS